MLSILDELEIINNRSGASLFSALQLLTLENLEDLIGMIRELEATSLSWSEITAEASSIDGKINKVQGSQNALIEAEKVFVSLGNVSPIKLMVLISNSETIEKLLGKRTELIAGLDPEFEDNGFTKKILEAHLDYSELPDSVVSVLFDEEGELAFDALAKLLPSFEKVQQSFSALMQVKGKNVVAQSIGLVWFGENANPKELFVWVGAIATSWEMLDEKIVVILASILAKAQGGTINLGSVIASLASQPVASSRIKLVQRQIDVVFQLDAVRRDECKKLLRSVEKALVLRNNVIHGLVRRHVNLPEGGQYVVQPPMYRLFNPIPWDGDPKNDEWMSFRPLGFEYNSDTLKEICDVIEYLSHEVENLAKRL